MELEEAIRTRRTHKAYSSEPVDRQTLGELFELARWAPNHHLTNPWRFRVLGPRALERLKEAAGPEAATKLDRAPTLVVLSAVQSGSDPHADEEDVCAAACAAYVVLLAAHGRGLAGYWRTPA
ncbi:MAG: nitroreductase family protein, partial [Actinomycetota bacterium]|nr:nitroreductase family protein [Actinomycetota bacterium]